MASVGHNHSNAPRVLNARDIHTQGSNFLQSVQTSVDPRTGQFNLSIDIPLGKANRMGGPDWSFRLAYSALASQADSGFGLGWSLNSTHLSAEQDIWTLRLSSGEQFAVDLSQSDLKPGGRLAFHDMKLESMQVSVFEDDQGSGEIGFMILHKNGEREFLQRLNNSGNNYLVHEMRSAEGRSLFFNWVESNAQHLLLEVRDHHRSLMAYDPIARQITLEPGSLQASTISFLQGNGELRALVLPETPKPFVFIYFPHQIGDQQLRLPTEITGPLGAQESINWSRTPEASHRLPKNAPIAFMPRVTSWLHSDGPSSAVLLRQYEWDGSHNYLGGSSTEEYDWKIGRDTLYQLLTRYEYSSTETQFTGDLETLQWLQMAERVQANTPQICTRSLLNGLLQSGAMTQITTISRTWDRHHLLVEEKTVLGSCETLSKTTYGVDYDLAWEQQSPQCQLPHLMTTTYHDTLTDRSLSEETQYEYDRFGNTLYARLPTQIEEVSEYYPASGEEPGCPADASGMVRFLKRKTVYPAPGCPGRAPVLSTRYQYEPLPSLISGDPPHIVVCLETLHDETSDLLLESTTQCYEHDPAEHYGRLKETVTSLNGKATTTLYDYNITQAPGEAPLLWTTTQTKGFEDSKLTTTHVQEARSLLSGLTHCQISVAGVRTVFTYDLLGRVTRAVLAEGTNYQAERTCTVHLDDEFVAQHAPRVGDALVAVVAVEETDATGQHKRSWLDGSSRPVLVQLEDFDAMPGLFRDVTTTRYDAWGREIEQVQMDWNGEGECLFTLATSTAYDDWGNVCRQTDPAGVTTHTLTDPTRRIVERWSESTAGQLTGKQVTAYNAAGSRIEMTVFDDRQQLVRTTQHTRDGLDRVIEQRTVPREGVAQVTQFEYDSYSRVTAQLEHFQQGEQEEEHLLRVTRWQYAPHSDGDHPESITVELAKAAIDAQRSAP